MIKSGFETVFQIKENEDVNFHHLGFVYFSKDTTLDCLKRLLKTYRLEGLSKEEELYFIITTDDDGLN